MALTHVHQRNTTVESTAFVSTETIVGNTRISLNRDSTKGGDIVPIGVKTAVAFAMPYATCQSFRMQSDQAMTVYTNSSGSPVDTIILKAGIPYIWTVNNIDTFLMTADVTGLYLTCTVAANFSIEALVGAP